MRERRKQRAADDAEKRMNHEGHRGDGGRREVGIGFGFRAQAPKAARRAAGGARWSRIMCIIIHYKWHSCQGVVSNFKCSAGWRLILVKASLGRLNVGALGIDVQTESQRWHVILASRSGRL